MQLAAGTRLRTNQTGAPHQLTIAGVRGASVLAVACREYFLALDEPAIALLLAQDGNDERLIEVIKELDMTTVPDEYGADIDQGDLVYLTSYLQEITAFYQRAAQAGRASVFVADQ